MPIQDFYIGDTKTLKFDIKRSTDQSPIDISNWEIYVTFKFSKDDTDGDAILQKVFTMPADANSAIGQGVGVLTSEDTNKFTEESKYYYDIQRVITGDPPDVATLEIGTVKVKQGVTRVDTPHTFIPDVTDVAEAGATTVLTNTGFVVGTSTTEASTTIDSGNVIRTDPIAGTFAEIGSTVDLVISQ